MILLTEDCTSIKKVKESKIEEFSEEVLESNKEIQSIEFYFLRLLLNVDQIFEKDEIEKRI